jgi:hypothetical protein
MEAALGNLRISQPAEELACLPSAGLGSRIIMSEAVDGGVVSKKE